MNGRLTTSSTLSGSLSAESVNTLSGTLTVNTLEGTMTVPTSLGGVRNYEQLTNKPSIESVELIGDKSFEELGLEPLDNTDLMELLTL